MTRLANHPRRWPLWSVTILGSLLVLLAAAFYFMNGYASPMRAEVAPAREPKQEQALPIRNSSPAAGNRPSEPAFPPGVAPPQFVDVAESLGIRFTYFRGDTGHFWPVEPVGGGAGWIDFDGDGWIDLVLVNSAQLPVDPSLRFLSSRLFRNIGGGRFEDVTELSGLLSHDYGQGCAVADFDNDGWPDLYVTNYGRSALYRNNGDATFTEVTDEAGVPGGEWNTGACFTDLNRDGILDLYVANYFHFKKDGYRPCRSPKGVPEYCGPSDSPALADVLYQGNGDQTFEDVSTAFGDPRPMGPAFGAVAADFDNDGWPELYVGNDAWPNFLFQNLSARDPEQRIRLQEAANDWGAAVNADGIPQASMGLSCGDFDRNGFLDVAVSNFIFEYRTLYLNSGDRYFVESSQRLGLGFATLATMGWGMGFLDYDNNGWLDLFIANGHINRTEYSSQPYEMKPQLFRNERGTRVREVSQWSGPYFSQPVIGRGVAFGDFDNDGRTDFAVVHHHRDASLLQNQTATQHSSITLELIGTASNRDSINAQVLVWLAPERPGEESPVILREIVSGDSYLSSNDRRVCIGLGPAGKMLRGEIRWPSGQVQTLEELPGGSRWRVIEGTGSEKQRLIQFPAPVGD